MAGLAATGDPEANFGLDIAMQFVKLHTLNWVFIPKNNA